MVNNKKTKIQLKISLSAKARNTLEPDDFATPFAKIGKRKRALATSDKRIEVVLQRK
jgi:hypothetical protein